MRHIKTTYEILKYLVGAILITAISTLVVSIIFGSTQFSLNYSAFNAAMVTLVTGALIAAFLGLFNSDKPKIKTFRKHILAAKTLYLIVFINCFLIVASSLFISSDVGSSNIIGYDLNLVLAIFSTTLMAQIGLNIYRLLNLDSDEQV